MTKDSCNHNRHPQLMGGVTSRQLMGVTPPDILVGKPLLELQELSVCETNDDWTCVPAEEYYTENGTGLELVIPDTNWTHLIISRCLADRETQRPHVRDHSKHSQHVCQVACCHGNTNQSHPGSCHRNTPILWTSLVLGEEDWSLMYLLLSVTNSFITRSA